MAQLAEAVVATLFDQSEDIANEVLHHNPLLARLDQLGRIRKFSGGYEIRKPVLYNDTAVGGFYSGFEAFTLDSITEFTAFQFAVKQVYEPLAISGREKRANTAQEMLLDLVDTKMEGTLSRLKNTVSTSLRGDGTGFGGREFDGLKKMVSSSPTSGTYGGITRSGNTWAQNTAGTGITLTAANIQEYITDYACRITRDGDGPDMGICDRTAWKYLHSSLTAIQRIAVPGKAMGGWKGKVLNYDGIDFVFDGGYGSSVLETNSVRLLTTPFISFDVERSSYFKPLEAELDRPVDQDAFFTVIIAEGNLCCSAPALNAYIGA